VQLRFGPIGYNGVVKKGWTEKFAAAQPLTLHQPMPDNLANGDDRPATKRDLQELRDELIEKMREMQTEVLRAFYDWARPIEGRLRTLDDVNTRLGLLEERVTAIERRNFGL
jgi:DNA-directed RNA polymerase sigma subunit (sigma70/sigma32)